MIVIDSSVWIALLRRRDTPEVAELRNLAATQDDTILVGDLILLEVLQGAHDETHAARIERDLRQFPVVAMSNVDLAVQAALYYRHLRSIGITVRKTIDMAIATFCLAGNHRLLHTDRDFEPMEVHLGLENAMAKGH